MLYQNALVLFGFWVIYYKTICCEVNLEREKWVEIIRVEKDEGKGLTGKIKEKEGEGVERWRDEEVRVHTHSRDVRPDGSLRLKGGRRTDRQMDGHICLPTIPKSQADMFSPSLVSLRPRVRK